jgi:putative intracellular protease/amidase
MTTALIVLTSHDTIGDTGRPTGFHAGEAAAPWVVFGQAGYEIDIASIRGGRPPVDGRDESDDAQKVLFAEANLDDTTRLADVDPTAYDVVFFAGGHGTMWDFPNEPAVQRVAAQVYERGGVVAAVCHGPAALVNVQLGDGSYLVDGKRVGSFTNHEEQIVGLAETVPFLLADALVERGAEHVPGAPWTSKVVVDGRLVTGQNPQSARGVAEHVVEIVG